MRFLVRCKMSARAQASTQKTRLCVEADAAREIHDDGVIRRRQHDGAQVQPEAARGVRVRRRRLAAGAVEPLNERHAAPLLGERPRGGDAGGAGAHNARVQRLVGRRGGCCAVAGQQGGGEHGGGGDTREGAAARRRRAAARRAARHGRRACSGAGVRGVSAALCGDMWRRPASTRAQAKGVASR
jgi:hypothetical protein